MVNILTFRFLRELQKKERATKELEKLDTDFYGQVAKYIEQKINLNLEDNSDFTSKRDLDHTKIIIKDILNRRERKVINLAMLNARENLLPKNILPEEKELFERITTGVKKYRSTLGLVLYDDEKKDDNETKIKEEQTTADRPEKVEEPKKENRTIKITILDNIPQFMADNGESYGPFKKDDIVDIPAAAAELLIKIKKAEKH